MAYCLTQVSLVDYEHVQRVCREMTVISVRKHHDLYLKTDNLWFCCTTCSKTSARSTTNSTLHGIRLSLSLPTMHLILSLASILFGCWHHIQLDAGILFCVDARIHFCGDAGIPILSGFWNLFLVVVFRQPLVGTKKINYSIFYWVNDVVNHGIRSFFCMIVFAKYGKCISYDKKWEVNKEMNLLTLKHAAYINFTHYINIIKNNLKIFHEAQLDTTQ